MTNGVNGENFFNNLSADFSKLYKEKDVELTKNDLQNIFNSAVKDDKDGVVSAKEFLKAAESFDAEKFGNISFLEKSKEFEEFTDAYNDIGMLDGTEGLSSSDLQKMFEVTEKKLPESVFKENSKMKTEDNKNYVEVENYNSSKADNNDCLTKIIKNNYDLDALGIKVGTKEYAAIEKAVMDANENIYGTDENPARTRIQDGQRHSSILYTGDKVVLPDLYENKELQALGIKRPEKAPEPEQKTVADKNSLEDLYGKLVENKDGKQVYVQGAKVTTIEKTDDGELRTTVDNRSSNLKYTVTEAYDKNGRKTSAEKISEDKEHHSKTTVSQTYDSDGRVLNDVVTTTDLNDKFLSGYSETYEYSENKGNTQEPSETTKHTHVDYKTGEQTTETTTNYLRTGEKHVVFKSDKISSDTNYDASGKVLNGTVKEETDEGTVVTTTSGDNVTKRTIPKEKSESHEVD